MPDYYKLWMELRAEIERLRDALRYCAGRLDHPRCPRCADRQQVAIAALKEADE